jgi:predicted 3-demethylubiquinone-9 3-methyltransferase (glyoxalase superfamily)
MTSSITPCIWFDTEGEEAAKLYTSLFPNSKITKTSYYGPDQPGPEGKALTVEFELDGTTFTALNGGPQFTPNEAISFQISCKDQDEVDHYWDGLVEGGGEHGPCGWLKDRFGVSWQVIPEALPRLLSDPDKDKANRVMQAMLKMGKLDVAELERAAEGVAV